MYLAALIRRQAPGTAKCRILRDWGAMCDAVLLRVDDPFWDLPRGSFCYWDRLTFVAVKVVATFKPVVEQRYVVFDRWILGCYVYQVS
jgi:hypothetical protein